MSSNSKTCCPKCGKSFDSQIQVQRLINHNPDITILMFRLWTLRTHFINSSAIENQCGGKVTHPLLMSLANIHSSVPSNTSSHAFLRIVLFCKGLPVFFHVYILPFDPILLSFVLSDQISLVQFIIVQFLHLGAKYSLLFLYLINKRGFFFMPYSLKM